MDTLEKNEICVRPMTTAQAELVLLQGFKYTSSLDPEKRAKMYQLNIAMCHNRKHIVLSYQLEGCSSIDAANFCKNFFEPVSEMVKTSSAAALIGKFKAARATKVNMTVQTHEGLLPVTQYIVVLPGSVVACC